MKEATYHVQRSADLVVRLGDGTERSHAMMQAALDELWPYTGEMFIADAVDEAASASRAGFDPGSLRNEWLTQIGDVLREATLVMPSAEAWMHRGGKQGRHTEHLSHLLA